MKEETLSKQNNLPVRMFWNADSTLVESRADVSMNDKLLRSWMNKKCLQTIKL